MVPMHVMTSFDLWSLQDTAKARAIQEAIRGGRSAPGACAGPVPNALVRVQLCFVYVKTNSCVSVFGPIVSRSR